MFKRLEVTGFKSFKDRTVFHFESGVTAIVGPNGSGKSNCAEAIRWVLGEQNARMLRGTRMEDIIFNGSDTEAPLNLAEVSLTLSNQNRILPIDYDEVTITRRAYRSGESEYLLNKTKVRLKDIMSLLMDSGIGETGYYLIEQGKIGAILNARPEERRVIFEEASGITKYKAKKREALNKLEQTEKNLVRVNDIVSEVERQIRSLDRQAKKAGRYQELFERLKGLDVKVSSFEFNKIIKERGDCAEELKVVNRNQDELFAKIGEFESGLKEESAKREEAGQRRSDVQRESLEMQGAIASSENKLALNKERIEELILSKGYLLKEIEAFDEREKELKSRIENQKIYFSTIHQQRRQKDEYLQKEQSLLHKTARAIEQAKEEIEEHNIRVLDIEAEIAKNKNALAKLASDIQHFSVRLRRLSGEKAQSKDELERIEMEFKKAVQDIEVVGKKQERLNAQKEETASSLQEKRIEIETLVYRISELKTTIAAAESKLEFLEDLRRRYEGFADGVKAIVQWEEKPGICGIVADMVEVEKKYELAIEIALGEDAQDVVVENIGGARRSLDYLRRTGAGRATFIPVEGFSSQGTTDILEKPGIIGRAIDFIKVEEKFKSLMERLLYRTYIVNEIEDAVLLFSELKDGCRFVTLSGDSIFAGKIQGGRGVRDDKTNLLGRHAKIRSLKQELFGLNAKSLQMERSRMEFVQECGEREGSLRIIEEELQGLNVEYSDLGSAMKNIGQQKERLEQEVSVLGLEAEEVGAELEQFKKEKERMEELLLQAEIRRGELEDSLRENQSLIMQESSNKERFIVEIAQVQTELEGLSRQEEDFQRNLQMLEDSFSQQESDLKNRRERFEQSSQKEGELKREVEELLKSIKEKKSNFEELESLGVRTQEHIDGIVSSLEERAVAVSSAQKELELRRSSAHNLEMKIAELGFGETRLVDRIRETYKVDLRESSSPLWGEGWGELESANAEIEDLRPKIDNMGTVNISALTEHSELTARFEFLTNQRKDLVDARNSLYQAIKRINRTTKELFLETFTKVQQTFKEFFRMLFGGGDAQLILIDKEDVLESGIEIAVRPPGKRLQYLTLLSGGEKALTAIALLFAVFKVKPSPFCVLDEIDAPLDEANVDRFSRMLADFVQTSQFIIITHNKKTLNIADAMYGITMQESGVSKVVSVKLTEE